MQIDENQKKEFIKEYFTLISKLNDCGVNNAGEARQKFFELNEKTDLISSQLESRRYSLSTLNSRKNSTLKLNIFDSFIQGLILDYKDFQDTFVPFLKRCVSGNFRLKDYGISFLLILMFLLITSLVFILRLEFILLICLFLLLLYIFITIKGSYSRIKQQQKKDPEKKKKEYRQKIDELESEYKQAQQKLVSLQHFLDSRNFDYIQILENQINEYLEKDIESLIQKGMRELKIGEYSDRRGLWHANKFLEREPIVSFIGRKRSGMKESSVISTDRELQQVEKKYSDLYINLEDFYEVKGIDGKKKYGVYEFVAVFLCDNFLAYYRCYWDFLKQAPVDEETCEYLYDSIVSIKTQVKSSVRLQDQDSMRTYRDLLSVTTMDGDILYIELSKDRKEKFVSSSPNRYVSDINEAAKLIRYWIRQRRVDYFSVEDRNR